MDFKLREKVRDLQFKGREGEISEIFEQDGETCYWFLTDDGGRYWQSKNKLELIKSRRGRPSKPKPIKFIALYEEVDKDPYKEFTSKKKLLEWLKEAQEDEDIVFDSIVVYPVGKPMKVETSFRLNEK